MPSTESTNPYSSGREPGAVHSPGWAKGGQTNPDQLWFACPRDHAGETNGHYTTTAINGRLAWTNGSSPPEINHAHHPNELLNDPDPPHNS